MFVLTGLLFLGLCWLLAPQRVELSSPVFAAPAQALSVHTVHGPMRALAPIHAPLPWRLS